MKQLMSKKESIIYFISLIYTIPFFILVCANMFFSLFQTTYMELYQDTEKPLYKADSPVLLLTISGILLLIYYFFLIRKEISPKFCVLLEKISLAWTIFLCLSIIFLFRVNVSCDSQALSEIAIAFLGGDYSSLTGDGYLVHYPHQLGMIGYLQLIYHIFGIENFTLLQLINVGAIFCSVYYLHRITEELFHDYKLQATLSFLCIGLLPLYLYSTFIYGDIPGLGFAVPAIYYFIRYYNTDHKKYLFPTVLLMTLAVVFKSNNMVLLVAFVLLLVLKFIHKPQFVTLAFAVLLLIGPSLVNGCVNAYYSHVSGISEMPSGIPKVAWIAMGLQENEYIENGWYNAYNWNVYTQNNYDSKQTTAVCVDSIKESLSSFIESPMSGLSFFYKKFISQWNDPGYQAQITNEWYSRHRNDHSPLALYLIYGNGRLLLEGIMNLYHFLVLLGSSVFALYHLRERKVQNTLLSLCVFGGYLFHLIWEAGGRYGLGYFVLCVPMAAWGLTKLTTLISNFIVNKKTNIKEGIEKHGK